MAYEEISINEGIASGSTATDSTKLFEEIRPPGLRKSISVQNISTGGELVYLALSPTGPAVAGKGITLYPGGTWAQSIDAGYKPWQGRIYYICSANTSAISYQQTILRQV